MCKHGGDAPTWTRASVRSIRIASSSLKSEQKCSKLIQRLSNELKVASCLYGFILYVHQVSDFCENIPIKSHA